MRWFSIFKQKSIKRHNHPSQREERTAFTPGFYRFLFGFSVIILISFSILFFLGLSGVDQTKTPPASPNPSLQLAP